MTVPKFRSDRKSRKPGQRPTKFAAILSSRQQLDTLREALRDVDSLELDLRVGTIEQARPSLMNGHSPDVLLVDFGTNQEIALNELTEFRQGQTANFEILATGQNASVDTIRRLMRLGIVDFVPSPFTRADILAGVNAALSKRSPRGASAAKMGKVLTFAGSCGGIGTTTIAIQSAAELRLRNSQAPAAVCVIDSDLQFGNVASALDLKSSVGLLQILEAPARLDRDFLASVTTHHSSGLDIITAPGRVVPMDALSLDTATDIVGFARQAYDFVVVDLSREWTNWSLGIVKMSDAIVLATEITVTGLRRCLQIQELLASQELQGVPLYLVVNRFKAGFGGGTRQIRQAEKVLGRKLDCFVRADHSTASEARDRGVLVQEVARRSKIERDVRRFVDRLIADFQRQDTALDSAPLAQQMTLEDRHVLQGV